MKQSKKILIIGASWEQYALIKKIKDQRHQIIATHPSIHAEGFQLADVTYVKDSRDIKAHLNIAHTHQIDAVVSDNCDYSFFTASVVAANLRLPFADIQSAVFSNDKLAQRERCAEYGITQPEFVKVRTLSELRQAANKIGYPLIVKPVDSRGTFGVTIIRRESELENAYYGAIDNSHSRTLICETFIPGTLVTVDGFCFKNGHVSLTVASRKFEPGEKPVTKEIIYPAQFSVSLNEKLLKVHNAVVNALGYQYGHTHGEYIVKPDDESIYLVECTNRGGGVYTSSVIVPSLTEIDLNEVLLNQSLGVDALAVENVGLNHMKKSIMLTFLDFEVGKVVKDINMAEVRQLPYVLRFRSIYSENDMVESIENCASRHSMLVIEGTNTEDMLANFDQFKTELQIQYY
jgi:biotin carboxylase